MVRYIKSLWKSLTEKPDPNSLLPKLTHEARVRPVNSRPKPAPRHSSHQ